MDADEVLAAEKGDRGIFNGVTSIVNYLQFQGASRCFTFKRLDGVLYFFQWFDDGDGRSGGGNVKHEGRDFIFLHTVDQLVFIVNIAVSAVDAFVN